MCNAMTHPAEVEVKTIEGLYVNDKGGKFECESLAREGRKIWSLYNSDHQNLQLR